jgi:hypothetical protein
VRLQDPVATLTGEQLLNLLKCGVFYLKYLGTLVETHFSATVVCPLGLFLAIL